MAAVPLCAHISRAVRPAVWAQRWASCKARVVAWGSCSEQTTMRALGVASRPARCQTVPAQRSEYVCVPLLSEGGLLEAAGAVMQSNCAGLSKLDLHAFVQ